jgi:hypothetical protein
MEPLSLDRMCEKLWTLPAGAAAALLLALVVALLGSIF